MKEKIKGLLVEELCDVYCHNCKFQNLGEEESEDKYGYWGCDDCHRKYMGWELSEISAENISDKICKIMDVQKYRWHDLRNNPKDLPEECKNVYVYFEYFRYGDYNCMFQDYGVSYQVDGKFTFVNGSFGWHKLSVIAWREIEPFEEE